MSRLTVPLSMLLAAKNQGPQEFHVERFCFDKQLAFIQDKARFKTAICSRRSGKTVACAADLISTALATPGSVSLYVTLSRINAKRIVWPEVTRINRLYGIGGIANETELSLKLPNGSTVYCSGAKDKSEIENFRGLAVKLAYIDEAQAFPDFIQDLVDDVISKALFDHNGTLALIGTPRAVPTGYFYECSQSEKWSHHGWTMFDNPFLAKKAGMTAQELVAQDIARMGIPITHPKIQRECFGRWVMDQDALVFRYDPKKNHYDRLPDPNKTWHYVMGIDLGYDDADAIAVLGWPEHRSEAYLVHEDIRTKQGITELASRIDALVKKYNPVGVVMDTGALGKKISEELQMRYGLPIQAAEKTRKFEFIELLNDAMRTERFYAQRNSRFAQDSLLVEWDKDAQLEKPKVADTFHSDILDAALYAYREALHWLEEPEKLKAGINTPEHYQEQEDAMEEVALAQVKQPDPDDIWGDY